MKPQRRGRRTEGTMYIVRDGEAQREEKKHQKEKGLQEHIVLFLRLR